MKKVLALVAAFALILSAAPAFAQVPDAKTVDNPDLQSYGAKSANKLGRGLGNIAFGWTQPIQDARKNSDGAKGPIQVWVEGFGNAVVRTAAGVAEVATSPIPSVEWEGDAEMAIK